MSMSYYDIDIALLCAYRGRAPDVIWRAKTSHQCVSVVCIHHNIIAFSRARGVLTAIFYYYREHYCVGEKPLYIQTQKVANRGLCRQRDISQRCQPVLKMGALGIPACSGVGVSNVLSIRRVEGLQKLPSTSLRIISGTTLRN